MNKYSIAGHIIELAWAKEYIHNNMSDFACSNELPTELTFEILESKVQEQPDGNPIISSSFLNIYQVPDGYYLFYPQTHHVLGCHYNMTLKTVTITLDQPLTDIDKTTILEQQNDVSLTIVDYIFFIIRDCFFIFLQQNGIIAVHSSSIIYNDKAYLFSASSGTGKTTHTDMWVKEYNVKILDGDVTAICMIDGQPFAYGLPWCGTSGHYLNECVALGGIIFIAKSCHNSLSKLTPFEAILRIAARCFTPTWTQEQSELNLKVAESIVPHIYCRFLGCLPNLESVELVKREIDSLT